MRKLMMISMMIVLGMLLVGCGNSNGKDEASKENEVNEVVQLKENERVCTVSDEIEVVEQYGTLQKCIEDNGEGFIWIDEVDGHKTNDKVKVTLVEGSSDEIEKTEKAN